VCHTFSVESSSACLTLYYSGIIYFLGCVARWCDVLPAAFAGTTELHGLFIRCSGFLQLLYGVVHAFFLQFHHPSGDQGVLPLDDCLGLAFPAFPSIAALANVGSGFCEAYDFLDGIDVWVNKRVYSCRASLALAVVFLSLCSERHRLYSAYPEILWFLRALYTSPVLRKLAPRLVCDRIKACR